MKTKVSFTIVLLCLVMLAFFGACMPSPRENAAVDTTEEELPVCTLGGIHYFSDSEKLFDHIQENEENLKLTYYYQPKVLFEGAEFTRIALRPSIYVTAEYTVESEFSKQFEQGSYDRNRTSAFLYKFSFYPDPEYTLKVGYADKGYEAIEYEGVKYYYFAECSLYSEKLIGHSIAYVNDGDLLYIHMPAIDKVENMLKYAAVEKVYCK